MGVVNTTGLKFIPPDLSITSLSRDTGLFGDTINFQGTNLDYVDTVKINDAACLFTTSNDLINGKFTVPLEGNTGYLNVFGDFIQLTGINPQPFWTMFQITDFSPNQSPSGDYIYFNGLNINTLTGIDFQASPALEDYDTLASGSNSSFIFNGGTISGNGENIFIQNINISSEQINTFISKKESFNSSSGYVYNINFTNTPNNKLYENHIFTLKTGIYSGFCVFNSTLTTGNININQKQYISLPLNFNTLQYNVFPSFLGTGIDNKFNYFISGKQVNGFYINTSSSINSNLECSFLVVSGQNLINFNSAKLISNEFSTIPNIFSYTKNFTSQSNFKYNELYPPIILTSLSAENEYIDKTYTKNLDFNSGLSLNLIYEKYSSGIYQNLYSINNVNIISGGSGYQTGQLIMVTENALSNSTYGILSVSEVAISGTTGTILNLSLQNSGIFTGGFQELNITSGYAYNISNITNRTFDFDIKNIPNEIPYTLNYLIINPPVNTNFNSFSYQNSGLFIKKIYLIPNTIENSLISIPSNQLNISGISSGSGSFIVPSTKYYINGPIKFKGLFDYERNDYGNFKETPDPISINPSGINTKGSVIISGRSFKKQNLIDGTGEYNSILIRFKNINKPKQKYTFENTFYILDNNSLSGVIELGSYMTGKYIIQALTEDGGVYE